jgi:hypothetical protein
MTGAFNKFSPDKFFVVINPATKYLYWGHSGESRNPNVLSWMPDQVRHDASAYLIAGLIIRFLLRIYVPN